MLHDLIASGDWLPVTFAGLMGLAMLIYAVLDGFDLGVGILMMRAGEQEQNRMIASIGPFWDGNETWLVLGVGLLLVAFPAAHGVILTHLYLPTAFMLIGLILRGVSFDFRVKARTGQRAFWNHAFFAGSLIMSVAQGYMLGSYILGFDKGWAAFAFSMLVGVCLAAGYSLIGACWLIMKTETDLQKKAVLWARHSSWATILGIGLVSAVTPLVSTRIFDKWFEVPNIFFLAPIPLLTGALVVGLEWVLRQLPKDKDRHSWVPFAMTVAIYVLCFGGLAYSFYPFIVPDQLTIVEAASGHDSLLIILYGALVVVPAILAYTVYSYLVFFGKATDLTYD